MMSSTGGQAPNPGSLRGLLPRVLLVLTVTTGIIDAVSYLGLGRVFSANMTGNVVLLGFGLAGAGGLPVLAPLISATAFLAGSAAGGMLAVRTSQRRRIHIITALTAEVVLIAAAAGFTALVDIRPEHVTGDTVIALLALAMGVRNATVRGLGVPDLTTTVLTMTLTGLSADSRLAGGSGKGTVRRGAAVAAMLGGAVVGALAVKSSLTLGLALAAGLGLATLAGFARYG
jgi:uncharacterized membrane protein YoaK (UPF0700 family)